MRKLVVLVGPTAVGKTEVSIQLCLRLNGEIVSCDSRLFYRGMDIGTAKPTFADRLTVPHHLIDVANPDENWSLAVFQGEAKRIISEIHRREKIPFLVGGTGQYLRAILQGWEPPAVEPDPRLRQALETWMEEIGGQGLHDKLALLDLQAAQNIDPRNIRRTIRALEVILTTGISFSEQRQRGPVDFEGFTLGLSRPRDELYSRVDARIESMIAMGLVDEVRSLLDQGYSPDLPPMSAIGYREIIETIKGNITLEDAVVLMKRATRQYIRRQSNWFKETDPDIHWFRFRPGVVDEMEAVIRAWL